MLILLDYNSNNISFEQNLMTHIEGLIVCNNCLCAILLSSLGKKIFKGLQNTNQIFVIFVFLNFCQNACRCSFTIILTKYDGLNLGNFLA